MAQPRTRDGSTISMPDIGIPVHRNRNDTEVVNSRSQTSRTPEERIQAIEAARVERDTLVAILEEHCRGIEQLVNNRGRRSILKHLKTQIHSRLEQVRNAHFLYNQRLWEANKPMTDAYTYIIGIEIHVRVVKLLAKLMKTLSLRLMNNVTISNRKTLIRCQVVQWIGLSIEIDSIPLNLYQRLGARLRLSMILDH
ncbi:hypothetical protein OUZ56_025543 [Daphnia magna]|uniref:Uncharacterized protein n=1 Tax=Daphnia magna TaxID=35525 RepID=A0ABQ9ZK61_9CRUS|nr:hypothetical protein OUZ56_025543 [Daphnia magna]